MGLEVSQAEETLKEFLDLKAKEKLAKEEASKLHSELQYKFSEFAQKLEENEMDFYKGKVASFSYKYEDSVLTPKNNEDKKAFYKYLVDTHGEDYAWSMISFNSQSINSFYKEQASIALEEKGQLDFSLPGLTKGTPHLKFSLRKTGEK